MLTLLLALTLLQAQPPAPKPPAAPGQPRVETQKPRDAPPPCKDCPITTIPPPADVPAPDLRTKVRAGVNALADSAPLNTPVAVGWCGNEFTKYWEDAAPEMQWYLVKINNVQQPWGGLLTKTPDGCYQTTKAYTFTTEGNYDLTVALVLPQGRETTTGTVPSGPTGGAMCAVGADCYGAASAPLVVAVPGLPPPPPVDCVMTDWSAWSAWSEWMQVSPTEDQRTRTRTRTVATPPSNNGAPCGETLETERETRAHIEPPPPQQDPCVTTPLKVTVNKWPAGQDGTRQGQWNSGAFKLVSVKFEWSPTLVFTATDSRGCTATVNK